MVGQWSRAASIVCACVITVVTAACAGAPRQRPIKMGPAGTGPGSLEFERQRLEGRWDLQEASLVDQNGKKTPVAAQGRLTLDAYGNLTVTGEVRDGGAQPPALPTASREMLQYAGRIVIDPQRLQFRLVDPEIKEGAAVLQRDLNPQLVRRYQVNRDVLTIELLDSDGRATAVTVFKRAVP